MEYTISQEFFFRNAQGHAEKIFNGGRGVSKYIISKKNVINYKIYCSIIILILFDLNENYFL